MNQFLLAKMFVIFCFFSLWRIRNSRPWLSTTCPSPAVLSPRFVIPARINSDESASGFWHRAHRTEFRVFKSRFRSLTSASRLESSALTDAWTSKSRRSTSAMMLSRTSVRRWHSSRWSRASSRKQSESWRKNIIIKQSTFTKKEEMIQRSKVTEQDW